MAASTWTVDDDGPADFTQVSAAIGAAAPGDVILVEPGTYWGFTLSKRLTILGRAGGARPRVTHGIHVTAQSFTLAGIDTPALHVLGTSDRGRVDDCRINYVEANDNAAAYSVVVEDCSELVISRTLVMGSKPYSQSHPSAGGSAMSITSSNVTLVGCKLEGAKGADPPCCGSSGGAGGSGLFLADGSRVLVTGSQIAGGAEGWSSGIFGCQDGPSGPGIHVTSSLLVLRGALSHGDFVHAGDAFPDACGATKAFDIDASESTIVISGVDYDPENVALVASSLIEPALAEPFIEVVGNDAPGFARHVRLRGPSGALAMLAVSLDPALVSVAAFDDSLWLDASGAFWVVPLVMLGQDTPLELDWTVPASTVGLVGTSIEMQPFFPGLPSTLVSSKSVAGNVAELIVRF